jgi:nucleoside phosphorylase
MPFVDYLVLTPLDEEWRTVRSVLCPVHKNVKSKSIGAITYYLWKQPVDQPPDKVGDYLIVAAPMSRETPGQAYAGVFTSRSLTYWKPDRIALLGIAGSLEPGRLKLGDVVVSHKICGYEVGDAKGRDLHFRPKFNQIGALDFDRVRAFRDDPVEYPKWQQECLAAARAAGLKRVSRPPELHIETTASGNFVVKSVTHGRKLRKEIDPKISAVEMEASGLHQALYLEAKRTDALMIRGVSDYADRNKAKLEKKTKDAWRTFCAANAARLLRTMWQRGPVPPLSPQYELNLEMGPRTRFQQPGIPKILFKQVGAQNVAFPNLISRGQPSPELTIEVTAYSEAGLPALDFRGLCIVESPDRLVIEPDPKVEGAKRFRLPASEWGLRVELLLSFRTSVDIIKVICRDDFQRLSEATVERPKS